MSYLRIVGSDIIYPYSIAELKQENSQTSFPKIMSSELLANFGIHYVVETSPPTYDSINEDLNEVIPTQIDNVWTQQWVVSSASSEDIAVRLSNWRSTLVLTPRQANLILLYGGFLDEVETWIAGQSRQVQIDWSKATEIRRDWPLINDAATDLGFTEAQLDEFFVVGRTLQ